MSTFLLKQRVCGHLLLTSLEDSICHTKFIHRFYDNNGLYLYVCVVLTPIAAEDHSFYDSRCTHHHTLQHITLNTIHTSSSIYIHSIIIYVCITINLLSFIAIKHLINYFEKRLLSHNTYMPGRGNNNNIIVYILEWKM